MKYVLCTLTGIATIAIFVISMLFFVEEYTTISVFCMILTLIGHSITRLIWDNWSLCEEVEK